MAWNFLSKLFVSQKSIDTAVKTGAKVTEGIMAGLDKIWFTAEEKSDAQQKATDTLLKFWETVAKENTEQSKARRILAVMTFRVYFFLLLTAVAVYKIDTNYSVFIFDVAGTLTILVTGVAAIYFGPHQISKIWKKKQ